MFHVRSRSPAAASAVGSTRPGLSNIVLMEMSISGCVSNVAD